VFTPTTSPATPGNPPGGGGGGGGSMDVLTLLACALAFSRRRRGMGGRLQSESP